MNDEQTLDHLGGKGEGRLHFEELDQHFQLKIRSFIPLCMPPIFAALDRDFRLAEMRRSGIAPIMFYLEFETEPQALAFGGRVETPFQIMLFRSKAPQGDSGASQERLLLDMRTDVMAHPGTGDPMKIVIPRNSDPLVKAGRMRAVHVLTRPVAAAGERQVHDVPEQLRGLTVHPWSEPYPSVEGLRSVPSGYHQTDIGVWREQRSVWGLNNTDINQHVNVLESIYALENHFTRVLFGASLPVERHRTSKANLLFRKPFFKGQAFGMRGDLWVHGDRTLMLAGLHRIEPEGGMEPQPSVFTRMEGVIGGRS